MQWIDEAQFVHRIWVHSAILSCASNKVIEHKRSSYKESLCPIDSSRHIQMKIDITVKWGEEKSLKDKHETTLPKEVVYEDTVYFIIIEKIKRSKSISCFTL